MFILLLEGNFLLSGVLLNVGGVGSRAQQAPGQDVQRERGHSPEGARCWLSVCGQPGPLSKWQHLRRNRSTSGTLRNLLWILYLRDLFVQKQYTPSLL